MAEDSERFSVQSAYVRDGTSELSANMEDILEMIYRMGGVPVRVRDLTERLGLSPPAASRGASALRDAGYCTFERYGFIMLNREGEKMGEYLVRRHRAVEGMLRRICGEAELREVEMIEHYIRRETVEAIERWLGEQK